jgi:hypothetical protein
MNSPQTHHQQLTQAALTTHGIDRAHGKTPCHITFFYTKAKDARKMGE